MSCICCYLFFYSEVTLCSAQDSLLGTQAACPSEASPADFYWVFSIQADRVLLSIDPAVSGYLFFFFGLL